MHILRLLATLTLATALMACNADGGDDPTIFQWSQQSEALDDGSEVEVFNGSGGDYWLTVSVMLLEDASATNISNGMRDLDGNEITRDEYAQGMTFGLRGGTKRGVQFAIDYGTAKSWIDKSGAIEGEVIVWARAESPAYENELRLRITSIDHFKLDEDF